jgi:hypothetical protein
LPGSKSSFFHRSRRSPSFVIPLVTFSLPHILTLPSLLPFSNPYRIASPLARILHPTPAPSTTIHHYHHHHHHHHHHFDDHPFDNHPFLCQSTGDGSRKTSTYRAPIEHLSTTYRSPTDPLQIGHSAIRNSARKNPQNYYGVQSCCPTPTRARDEHAGRSESTSLRLVRLSDNLLPRPSAAVHSFPIASRPSDRALGLPTFPPSTLPSTHLAPLWPVNGQSSHPAPVPTCLFLARDVV